MKQTKRCPKCHSLRIGYVEEQLDRNDVGRTRRVVGTHLEEGFFPRTWEIGVLEAYVCGDCGYFESYVKSPGEVPWDKLRGFRWINETSPNAGPYR